MDKGYEKIIRTRPIYKTVMNVSDKTSEQQKTCNEKYPNKIIWQKTEQQRTYKTYKQNKMNITTNNQKKKIYQTKTEHRDEHFRQISRKK